MFPKNSVFFSCVGWLELRQLASLRDVESQQRGDLISLSPVCYLEEGSAPNSYQKSNRKIETASNLKVI